jgi:hypothetical protein
MLPGGLFLLSILHLNRIGKTWLNISVHGESRPRVSKAVVGWSGGCLASYTARKETRPRRQVA